MADVIVKRTIFMDIQASPVWVADWARVLTADGQVMIEPFHPFFRRSDSGRVIEGDECNRVDAIEYIDRVRLDNVMSFGAEQPFHGGIHTPR